MRSARKPVRHTLALCTLVIFPLLSFSLLSAPSARAQTLPSSGSKASGTRANNTGVLDSRLEKAISDIDQKRIDLHVPGAALVIVKDDRIVAIRGLGVRDVAENLPVTPETLFAIGSSTKAFTAMTVLMTAEDGKLKLTDPPRKYLPAFKLQDADADSKITISDLLCHRCGLERTDLAWYTGKLNSREIIRVACEAKPTAKFGEKFQYQNIMFLTAGEVAAAAQKRLWSDLLYWRILRPLGMKSTTLSVTEMQDREDFSRGYSYNALTRETRLLPTRDIRMIAPAGAINSNVQEMAQWLRLMLGGGVFNGKRLVSQASIDQLTSKHMAVGGGMDYGYGWFLHDWHGHKVVEHGGNIDGFSAEVALMPDQKLGFVLLTNQNNSALQQQSLDLIWSDLVDLPAPAPGSPSATPVKEVASSEPAGDPQKEVGVYTLAPGLDLTVSCREGKLYAQATNQPEFSLKNLGGRKYTIGPPVPPGIYLTFHSAKGDPNRTELEFEQGGFKVTALAKAASTSVIAISAEELFNKAVAAAGGAENLRKVRSLSARFVLDMPTQGITGEGIDYRMAPNSEAQTLKMRAAGKQVATIRSYFDGKQGGSFSSFSSSEKIPENRLNETRIAADFYPLLNWKTNFKTVTIKGTEKLGDEEVYLIEETPEKGNPIIERYSTRSFLLLQRDRKILEPDLGITISSVEKFSDYRPVNGVMFPFKRIQTQMDTNETHIEYKEVRFDARIPASAFRTK